jgi:hypothetical protein
VVRAQLHSDGVDMTIDKAALIAQAKADPRAFAEPTAKALDTAGFRHSADLVRRGDWHGEKARWTAELLRWGYAQSAFKDECAEALMYVDAFAEAVGVRL